MDLWGGIRRGIRGFFSGMVRGVSNPREGSKILSFLFRPRLVYSWPLHLRNSWKVNSLRSSLAISEPRHVAAAKYLSTVVNHGCHAAERRHNQSEET
jgi:hypothetical protein